MKFFRGLTFEAMIRVLADFLIVNFAYLMALVIRLLWEIARNPAVSAHEQLIEAIRIYGSTMWLLSVIAICVYSACGFYSRGRFYRSRFKVLVIVQAVSLTYLLFGFALYLGLARDLFVQPPRAAFLLGWILTLLITAAARLWTILLRLMIKRETPALRKPVVEEPIRHVLVIGGAGYIGSVVCRQLLRGGFSVRVLDAFLYTRESLTELSDNPRFELVEGDSRDVSAVFRAMLDMDAVVHLGEVVGDPACTLDENMTLEINLAATRMVAEAAQGYGIRRFVYASSCSVYGASPGLLDERSELNPVSLYARAKIGCERTLLALNGASFHPVILRLGTVYGLSPRPRFDLVVNVLTAKAVCDSEITVFGGNQWRPFVHVEDVAQAILRSIKAPLSLVKGAIFNVGSDTQNYTISQIGELIQRAVPEARLVSQGNDSDRRDYRVSFAKIRRELGFEPTRTVEDGIREIVAALRTGKIPNYSDPVYSNYKTLSDTSNHIAVRSRYISRLYTPSPEKVVEVVPVAALAQPR